MFRSLLHHGSYNQNAGRLTKLPTLGEILDGSDSIPPDDVAGETLLEVIAPPLVMGLNSILGLVIVRPQDHSSTGNLGS